MSQTLSIMGTGIFLPPSRSVADLAKEAGTELGDYNDWPNVGLASDDDHPGNMGAAALTAALENAEIMSSDLDFILSCGMSRDYPPSWSMASEWARLTGARESCWTLDITAGCAGTIMGLDMIMSHLAMRGGGYAAIVVAERTSQSIDRGDPGSNKLWGFGDAAGAIIVSLNRNGPSRASFHGVELVSKPHLNGTVLIQYGGTRYPAAPPGENPGKRVLHVPEGLELSTEYRAGYTEAFARMKKRFGVDPDHLLVNQISVNIVQMIGEIAGVKPENIMVTGTEHGHCAGADVIIGLHRHLSQGDIKAPISLAGSTPYIFGAGLIDAP